MRPSRSSGGVTIGLAVCAGLCVLALAGAASTYGEPQPTGAGQLCGINLVSLSKTSGYPGDTFDMLGTWGAAQGDKEPCINKGTKHDLIVVTWTPTKLTVKIPPGLEPGTYRVGVYCNHLEGVTSTYSSGWKDFEILKPLPDITSRKGIIIGGAVGGAGGKAVAWGGSVELTQQDVLHGSANNECAVNLSYDLANHTPVPTDRPFVDRIKVDTRVVSIQSALSLQANETKQINTQAYLPPGRHTLSLWLDDDKNIAERPPNGESNNVLRITYSLRAKCAQLAK